MATAQYGETEIAKLLITPGADVNTRDSYGLTTQIYEIYSKPIERFKYKNANLIKALAIGTVVGVAYKLWQNLTK